VALRAGVIGVGYLGRHHARIYSELEDVELAGVADISPAAADETAKARGCKAFADYRELIAACDILSIVTPTTSHHNIAMDCIRAGKDILVEKPITENIEEAEELVEEAAKKGLVLQVGHLERYNPGIIASAGMIGEPRFIESERLSPFLGRATDVDVTLDLMIHDIDIVMSLVHSEINHISGIGESLLTDKIDVAKVWLEFANGCRALITASRLSPEKKRTLKVYQKDAYISVDYQTHEVRRYYKSGKEIAFDAVKPENKEPLKEELKDFVGCVKNRKRPKVSGAEALEALRVALKINDMLKGAQA